MKANWKMIGIGVGVAAALLAYPAIKLYQYIAGMLDTSKAKEEDHPVKTMRIVHHKQHTPHHRVAHN